MKRKLWRIAILTVLAVGLGFSISAAQTNMPSYFDSITGFQEQTAEIWKTRAFVVSSFFFGLLLVIQGSFYGYRFFSKKFAVNKGQVVRKFATLLILYVILFGFYQLENIIYGLRDISLFIIGQDQQINEMGLIQEGFEVALKAGDPFQESGWLSYLKGVWNSMMTGGLYWIATWGIVISYVVMALQYAYITIEIMIVLAIGPVPLAFGGLDFSRGIAESYIKYLFELGFKIFIFYFVFGVSRSILSSVSANVISGSLADMGDAWWMIIEIGFIAILSMTLLLKLPGPIAKRLTEKLNPKFENLF